jgi:LysE type translocator.
MAGIIMAMDLAWFTVRAIIVARAERAFVERGWASRMERISGIVLMALGIRLAFQDR